MDFQNQIKEGMTVRSSDGHKLGKVVRLSGSDFIIEKGLFFQKEFLCSYTEIGNVQGDEVILSATKDQLMTKEIPAGTAASTTKGYERGYEGTTRAAKGAQYETGYAASGARASTTEETRIPLAEERLEARKVGREAGEVRIRKDVIEEERELKVPVTREEVRVERVPAGERELRAGEASFQEGTTRIPVYEEEVEISKRPVVREEVRVGKESYTEERRATETVRRETADIEGADQPRTKFEK